MRRILASPVDATGRLRIAVILHERAALNEGYMVELIHLLREEGHAVIITRASLMELGMNVKRIARFVNTTTADAWIVFSGSREVTEWFASQPIPAIALFGRRRGVPIASVGPDKSPAYAAATRRLIELGHHRIVLVARPERRLPVPGAPEHAFLAELAAHGITPGPYHLPEWKDGINGFHARLDPLFRLTAPTALIVDEALLCLEPSIFSSKCDCGYRRMFRLMTWRKIPPSNGVTLRSLMCAGTALPCCEGWSDGPKPWPTARKTYAGLSPAPSSSTAGRSARREREAEENAYPFSDYRPWAGRDGF